MEILTIASLTIREAARRRLVLALVILTLVVIGLTGWGFQHLTHLTGPGTQPLPAGELRLGTAQVLILVEFMFSAILALSAVVAASPSISGEVESGISLAMLGRPLGRHQVVLGKWLGLGALIAVYTIAASTLELVVVALVSGYSPPAPVPTVAYLVAEGIAIMSLTLLLSTRLSGMTAGVVSLVLFFVAWIGGIAGTIGEVSQQRGDPQRRHGQPAPPAHRRTLAGLGVQPRTGLLPSPLRGHRRPGWQPLLRGATALAGVS